MDIIEEAHAMLDRIDRQLEDLESMSLSVKDKRIANRYTCADLDGVLFFSEDILQRIADGKRVVLTFEEEGNEYEGHELIDLIRRAQRHRRNQELKERAAREKVVAVGLVAGFAGFLLGLASRR